MREIDGWIEVVTHLGSLRGALSRFGTSARSLSKKSGALGVPSPSTHLATFYRNLRPVL
jgi:hypothetical protein